MSKTIEDLIAEGGVDAYTREQFEEDRARLLVAIAAKHGIAESEVEALIKEHRYEHSAEDLEDEYIQAMAMARGAGWLGLGLDARPPDHYTVHVRRKVKAGPVSYETALARVAVQNAGTPIYLGCTERWWVFACPNRC
jgi:hypothetical protein